MLCNLYRTGEALLVSCKPILLVWATRRCCLGGFSPPVLADEDPPEESRTMRIGFALTIFFVWSMKKTAPAMRLSLGFMGLKAGGSTEILEGPDTHDEVRL
jgi:hypothetical protein